MSEQALRIVVLVKQVPDTANVTGDAMKDDGTVNRAALPAIFNPEDLNALELGLRLRERCGGRVTVLTMGPPSAAQVLRESLFRGADEVVLLSDRAFAGADTLATSYALARAIEHLGETDLVLCGRQAIDGDTAQVGPQIAEKLALPQITGVSRVDAIVPPGSPPGDPGSITATRTIEDGTETLQAPLPALLTVTGEAGEPRPPSVKLVMTYKNAVAEAMPGYDDSYLDPDADEAEVCMIGARRPARVPRQDRALGRRRHRSRARDGRPARLADARQEDRERGAGRRRGAPDRTLRRGRARPRARADRGAHPWLALRATSGSSSRRRAARRAARARPCSRATALPRAPACAPPRSASSCWARPANWPRGSARAWAPWCAGGEAARALAPALVAAGADTVYLAVHDLLGEYLAQPYTRVVTEAVRHFQPQIVLYGATTTGRDLAPRVASALRTGLTADCTDLRIGDHEAKGVVYHDLLYQIRPAFGGNIIATIVSPEHRPQMATVREGVFRLPLPDPSRSGDVVELNVERVAGPHTGRNGKPTSAGGPIAARRPRLRHHARAPHARRRSRST